MRHAAVSLAKYVGRVVVAVHAPNRSPAVLAMLRETLASPLPASASDHGCVSVHTGAIAAFEIERGDVEMRWHVHKVGDHVFSRYRNRDRCVSVIEDHVQIREAAGKVVRGGLDLQDCMRARRGDKHRACSVTEERGCTAARVSFPFVCVSLDRPERKVVSNSCGVISCTTAAAAGDPVVRYQGGPFTDVRVSRLGNWDVTNGTNDLKYECPPVSK